VPTRDLSIVTEQVPLCCGLEVERLAGNDAEGDVIEVGLIAGEGIYPERHQGHSESAAE
jgi:hypothetical protein